MSHLVVRVIDTALPRAHIHHVLLCRVRRRVIDRLFPQVADQNIQASFVLTSGLQALVFGSTVIKPNVLITNVPNQTVSDHFL